MHKVGMRKVLDHITDISFSSNVDLNLCYYAVKYIKRIENEIHSIYGLGFRDLKIHKICDSVGYMMLHVEEVRKCYERLFEFFEMI